MMTTSNEHNNAPAVPRGEQATIAGLDAANGHLSTLLDDSVLMLKQLRQMVDDLHDRWSNGGKPERGEFELLDRVDDWLSCRPDSMPSPPAPNVLQEPVMWQYRTWFAENTGTPGWSEWAEVKARNAYTGTVMDSVREFQHYIAQGYKYEIRAIYAATPAPAPAQEAIACGLCQGAGVLSPTQKCICQYGGKEPAQEVGLTDAWLLEQFKNYHNWELSTSNDPECDPSVFWLVHEVKGGRNDHEWFLIGEGDSPRAAILAALRAKGGK